MDRFWFLTWTTYGTWLPGDDRGFVTDLRDDDWNKYRPNQPATAYPSGIPPLRAYAATIMKGEPVWLTAGQVEPLLAQFRETADYRGCQLLATAVMANHAHVVVGVPGDPDPSAVLGDFKGYGSRALNRRFGRRPSGTWWAQSGSKRKLPGVRSRRGAVAYVRDQYRPLVVWLNEAAVRAAFDDPTATVLLSPERDDESCPGERRA